MRLADRVVDIGTETAFEVLAKAKALEAKGRDIVHLEIGEPDFDTPDNIRKACADALWGGQTHYGPSAGLIQTREAIAEYIAKDRAVTYGPDEIVVTPGGKPVIFFTALALLQDGDETIYPNPGYPIYESAIEFAGAKAVPLVLREEKDFRFDLDELTDKITDRTRLIIINSPQNPTGGVLLEGDLKVIAELAVKNDIMVLSDEVYSKIIYEGEHHTIATFPGMKERTVLLDAHSKTYAMTGWRMGYALCNKVLAERMTKLMTNSVSHVTTFVQFGGIEALKGSQEEAEKMVKIFRERRDVIINGLNEIDNISCIMPKGAFYAFPNVKKIGMDCHELADYLLTEAGVALLSGTCFGAHGDGYLRLSYANSVENIQKGLARISDALKKVEAKS
jgi:aspartate/methionine/tyrosine aminotransferase